MLIVIPLTDATRERAERLCDLLYWRQGQQPKHHVLIVAAEVHEEFRIKVRIAAELAFETVDMIALPSLAGESPEQKGNSHFIQAARYVRDTYREEWLWMEPHCVPLTRNWVYDLEHQYGVQPKRFLGPHLMSGVGRYMAKVAVYPPDAFRDLEGWCASTVLVPFERPSGDMIVPRSTMTKAIQIGTYAEGLKLWPEAVILCGDLSGGLVEKMIEQVEFKAANETRDMIIKRMEFGSFIPRRLWRNDLVVVKPAEPAHELTNGQAKE